MPNRATKDNFSLYKARFIQPISYGSATNIGSYFESFVFHLFSCTFSILKAYYFKFSILTVSIVSIGSSFVGTMFPFNGP